MWTLFLILAILLIGYGWSGAQFKKEQTNLQSETQPVYAVEAGPTCECGHEFNSSPIAITPISRVRLKSGKCINTKDYIRIKIQGSCMTPRGVLSGKEWLVQRWDGNVASVKKRDILMIHLKDKDIYKIREVEEILIEKHEFVTIHYPKGIVQKSSKNHSFESVVGILRYGL